MKKTILVSVEAAENRVAVLEAGGDPARLRKAGGRRKADEWRIAELYVERRNKRSIVGNIYKGKVDNALPGLEAAFVDIGLERNGFLHVDEIITPDGKPVPKRGRGQGRQINELIKPGQELIVQVIKDPLKTKGARLTMQTSIAGRYLVYMPHGEGVGVSRRLPDDERKRLRGIAQSIEVGGGGAIVRTAAQGASEEDFQREIVYLHKLNEVLGRRAGTAEAPSMVFQEADLSVRVIRDILLGEFEQAIIDDPKQHGRVTSFLTRTAPELVEYVHLYEGDDPLFEGWGAEEAIASTLSRRVDLPSGGYLMIDYAEALTVIDINTGSFTGRGGGGRLEDTITKVNVEAAEEVVRQLRLRDIGGIIVIDFIDMARSKNRRQVKQTLQKALDQDKTKSYVVEVSPIGLVEMTRENVTDGVREILTERCGTCDGEGVVKSPETVAIEVLRGLPAVIEDDPEPEAYLVRVHPKVAAVLVAEESGLEALERRTGKHFQFEGGEALPIDTFQVADAGGREEITERALPFRVGDEVLVQIEEPHMYDPEDAIAKVDGYVVSVKGAAPFVSERRLVQIESVERSSATATLVGVNPEELRAEQERLQSGGRGRERRGRRGGRNRSGKGAGSSTSGG